MTLDERIIEAQRRISAGLAPMRIPADQCDPDIVLSACQETIAELVEVMAMALGWAECDAKSLAAIEARNRWPDHLPTGFETRVARLRSVLAKAKESANG